MCAVCVYVRVGVWVCGVYAHLRTYVHTFHIMCMYVRMSVHMNRCRTCTYTYVCM